jgi:hypothetical protein
MESKSHSFLAITNLMIQCIIIHYFLKCIEIRRRRRRRRRRIRHNRILMFINIIYFI